ncbi:MAG TPA: hypothetical protein VLK83_08965, partial [Rhodanobacteraceae bacterium]|nr:hypothetical protein [Rhodanobacteraceae bacterium]
MRSDEFVLRRDPEYLEIERTRIGRGQYRRRHEGHRRLPDRDGIMAAVQSRRRVLRSKPRALRTTRPA